MKCRALLDTCATANFITESVVKQLGVRSVAHTLPIYAINATSTALKGIVRVTIRSIRDDFSKELTCLTIPNIADSIPSETFPRDAVKIPSNIKLADPQFHLPRSIDLLIGSGRPCHYSLSVKLIYQTITTIYIYKNLGSAGLSQAAYHHKRDLTSSRVI